MKLIRVMRGHYATIHRVNCRYAKSKHAYPWKFARGKSHTEIWKFPWNIPCKVCKPKEEV